MSQLVGTSKMGMLAMTHIHLHVQLCMKIILSFYFLQRPNLTAILRAVHVRGHSLAQITPSGTDRVVLPRPAPQGPGPTIQLVSCFDTMYTLTKSSMSLVIRKPVFGISDQV